MLQKYFIGFAFPRFKRCLKTSMLKNTIW